MAVFNDHSALDRLPNGNIILRHIDNGARHQYSIEQLRLYSRFDFALRGGRVSGPGLLVPAGYSEFRELWAQDDACRFQFVEYDRDSGAISLAGVHLPPDQLAPVREAAPAPPLPRTLPLVTTPAAAAPPADARRQAIVDTLILDQLERGQRVAETIRARRERRERERAVTAPLWAAKQKVFRERAAAGPRATKGKGKARALAAPPKEKDAPMDVDQPLAPTTAPPPLPAPTPTPISTAAPAQADGAGGSGANVPKKLTEGGADEELVDYHSGDEHPADDDDVPADE